MEILEITDNKDGTCTLDCECTEDEIRILLSYAVTNILKEVVKDV